MYTEPVPNWLEPQTSYVTSELSKTNLQLNGSKTVYSFSTKPKGSSKKWTTKRLNWTHSDSFCKSWTWARYYSIISQTIIIPLRVISRAARVSLLYCCGLNSITSLLSPRRKVCQGTQQIHCGTTGAVLVKCPHSSVPGIVCSEIFQRLIVVTINHYTP